MTTPDKSILVCFALKAEAVATRRLMAKYDGVSILITGVGRNNAAMAAGEFLMRSKPASVYTCGFAGGLDPNLKIGDVVFETEDVALKRLLIQAGGRPGKILCVDHIAVTSTEKIALRQRTLADAIEMESEAIHGICRERSIPCTTIRSISDAAHEDLPLDFNQFSQPDQSIDYSKLALAVMKKPQIIPELIRLHKNCRLAAERLGKVLLKLIPR